MEMVQIIANGLGPLDPDPVIAQEVRHPPGWVNLVIGAIRLARRRRDFLDSVFQLFFTAYHPGHAGKGREVGDVELHGLSLEPFTDPAVRIAR